MTEVEKVPTSFWGYTGMFLGACALMIVLVHFWIGPIAPQQSIGVSLGELAAEIKQSAVQSLMGKEPPLPENAPWDGDRFIKLGAAVLAGVAVLCGAVAFVKHETKRPAVAAVALGGSAIVMQMFIWMFLVTIGCLLIMAVMKNMDGIVDF